MLSSWLLHITSFARMAILHKRATTLAKIARALNDRQIADCEGTFSPGRCRAPLTTLCISASRTQTNCYRAKVAAGITLNKRISCSVSAPSPYEQIVQF
jgi:hypothetical protein